MKKLEKRKKLFLSVAIASAVLGVASVAGTVIFILNLLYVPMAVCILIAAHGFYGCPFYFIEYANLLRCGVILSEIEKGETNISLIAERAGITVDFADKLIKKSLKAGFLGSFPTEA